MEGGERREADLGSANLERADLEDVCERFWRPLHTHLLGRGHSHTEADDLTQEFFARLIEKGWLTAFDPARGKLGSFLQVLLKRFLANEWHKQHCQKRGGGQVPIPLHTLESEQRDALEPIDHARPDTLYDQQRAAVALEEAIAQLRAEACAHGTGDRFDLLEPTLFGEPASLPYAELAARFGMTETGVKSLTYRLRQRMKASMSERKHDATPGIYKLKAHAVENEQTGCNLNPTKFK